MNSPPSSEFPLWHLFGLEPDRLTPIERTLLRVALFVSFFVLAWTYYVDFRTAAGNDLRNRVVGARVMLAGHDPYTFNWQPGMPEELLDPIYEPKTHRLTVSPPTLLLYAIAAPVPYRIQRFGWFVAEWLAMIVSVILLARSLPEQRQRVVFLVGATLFVIATDVWRLHLERGQLYVFQLLALSAAITCARRGKTDTIAAGIAFGVLALLRPNLLVFAPALFLMRQWRSSSAMLATVAVGVTAAFLMLPTSSWQSYLDVGDQYSRAVEDPRPGPNDRPGPELTSRVIEGVEFGNALSNVSSSSFAYTYYLLSEHYHWPMIDLALTSKVLLACLASVMLILLFLVPKLCLGTPPRKLRFLFPSKPAADTAQQAELAPERSQAELGNEKVFALAVALALNTEFFLPHRWGYVDVMLLAPLALMLPMLLKAERANQFALAVVLVGLLSGPFGQQFVGLHAATILRSWLVMGGLTAQAIISASQERRNESASA